MRLFAFPGDKLSSLHKAILNASCKCYSFYHLYWLIIFNIHQRVVFLHHSPDVEPIFGAEYAISHHVDPFLAVVVVGWHYFIEKYLI